MEWVDGLNRSIAYIESHLTEEIDYAALARLACCSTYHYQRMFASPAPGRRRGRGRGPPGRPG